MCPAKRGRVTSASRLYRSRFKKNGRVVCDKVKAVNELKDMGYNIKESCEALCIPRSSYYASLHCNLSGTTVKFKCREVGTSNDKPLQEIKAIKAGHPLWGYRKVRRSFGTVRP